MKKRIYNAEALLQNTQYNINEIAQIIGYDNPLYFMNNLGLIEPSVRHG